MCIMSWKSRLKAELVRMSNSVKEAKGINLCGGVGREADIRWPLRTTTPTPYLCKARSGYPSPPRGYWTNLVMIIKSL